MVGHVPREISLPIFFNRWNSTILVRKVRDLRSKGSPILKGILGIPNAGGEKTPPAVFDKLK